MASDWFLLPGIGEGTETDPFRPEHVMAADGIDGWAGRRLAQSNRFVGRVYGTPEALDSLESTPRVARLPDDAMRKRLAEATGRRRERSEWNRRFVVET